VVSSKLFCIRFRHAPVKGVVLGLFFLSSLACSSSQEEIAFSKIVPGLTEGEVINLLGTPEQTRLTPLPSEFRISCWKRTYKILVYKASSDLSYWVFFDKEGRVLCSSTTIMWTQQARGL
jgi:hypothetical protein